MAKLRWPNTAEDSARMRQYKSENLRRSLRNPNENWMAAYLERTGLKWTRQAIWGFRIFDFWCYAKGIVVEVDGPEHRKAWDAFRDRQNFERSGILVLRVRNRNDEDARIALDRIADASCWNDRRKSLGLNPIGAKPNRSGCPTPKPTAVPTVASQPRRVRCTICSTWIRSRRPDGRVRCRCGVSATPTVA